MKKVDADDYSIMMFGLIVLLIFLAGFPMRNYLEIRSLRKISKSFENWLSKKPNKEQFCIASAQKLDSIACNFCGAKRLLPRTNAVIAKNFSWGFLKNTIKHNRLYKSYFCTGCGTELFREVIDIY